MSCAGLSRVSMIPAEMADYAVLSASSFVGGDGDIQCKTDGAVDFVLLVLGHVFIVAVFVVGGTDTLCTVIRLVLQIANSTFLFFLDLLKPFFANI